LQIDSSSYLGRSHSGQTFGLACRCSRADPDKPFRPISSFDETIVSSHIAADSGGRIFLGAFSVPRGAQTPPGVQIQCRRGPIRVPTNIHSSIETRVHPLEQFQAHSDGGFFRSSFPAGSGCRISPESHILPIYPCMHQICYLLMITSIFCYSIVFQYRSRRSD
jgi:hypothetical protein